MTIRKKIWWIYLISVLVPAILLIGATLLSTRIVRVHIDNEVENIEKTYFNEPLDKIIQSIEDEMKKDSTILENESYVNILKSTLRMTPFELQVYKNDSELLVIKKDIKDETIETRIIREGYFLDEPNKSYEYVVSIHIREPRDKFNRRISKALIQNGAIFLVLYMLIHFIFFKISIRTIFAPLEKMRTAALRIRDKKYDEPLIYDGRDEVGQVFEAFEEMRVRIEESHQLQEQYEENRKELIANISHDLKTPITAINGYVQGILDGVANTEDKLQSYIETIAVYSKDMDTLIDDLSLLSKLDIDGILFNFKSVAFVPYIDDCIEEISFDLEEKGIHVVKEYDARKQTKTKVDGAQVKRVLNNIIFNAAKHFDKEKHKLLIRLYEDDHFCYVAVSDNGCGIEADKLVQIFDRFYRVDASRNSETGGSGLGLSIAQKIVHAHGGEIEAESEIGNGTTITFSLEKIKEV